MCQLFGTRVRGQKWVKIWNMVFNRFIGGSKIKGAEGTPLCSLGKAWRYPGIFVHYQSNSSPLFIHYPCLSLLRAHWRELMSHTSGSRWLIFMKRGNCIASPFFDFLSEALPVLHPMSQIPPFNLVIPSAVVGSVLSVSMKPLPNTPAPSVSRFHKQYSAECTTQFGFNMCLFGFLFITRNCVFVCFILLVSFISNRSKYSLFYPIILTAPNTGHWTAGHWTLGTEQLEVISPSSELSEHLLCTTSVTHITSYFVLQLFENVGFFPSAEM